MFVVGCVVKYLLVVLFRSLLLVAGVMVFIWQFISSDLSEHWVVPSQTKCKGMQYPSGHWWGHMLEVSVVRKSSVEGSGGVFVDFWEFISPVRLFPA